MMVVGIKMVTITLGKVGLRLEVILKIKLIGFADQESHKGIWV